MTRSPIADPELARPVLAVSALWGDTVLDTAIVNQACDLNVGDVESGLDVPLDIPPFTFARNKGRLARLIVPPSAKLIVRTGDGATLRDVDLESTPDGAAYTMAPGETVGLRLGSVTLVARYISGDVALGAGAAAEWRDAQIFATSALVHASVIAAALVTPRMSNSLSDHLTRRTPEMRKGRLISAKPTPAKPLRFAGGPRHRGNEGALGSRRSRQRDAAPSRVAAQRVTSNKRAFDENAAKNAGLLGILKRVGGASTASVFQRGGLGGGLNIAVGGLRGTRSGDRSGVGGLGVRGAGPGGGGDALTIGTLRISDGPGGPGDGPALSGRKRATKVRPQRSVLRGDGLSRAEVGRVIRRNLARFRHCYEKELNARPYLQGKVSVRFTIAPTGLVARASVAESTIDDGPVEKCAAKVMRSLRFPTPRGGGVVMVNYPFIFEST